MAEINNLISKDALATIERLEQLLKLSSDALDKVIVKSKEYNTTIGQLKGDKLKEVQAIQAETLKNTKALADEQKKITQIKENLAKSTDKVAEATIRSAKSKKDQKDRIKETLVLEDKEAGTLEKLAARNRQLTKERSKLNLETKKGQDRLKAINKELDKNNKVVKDSSDALGKQKINIGNYSSALSGMKSPLGGAIAGVQAFGKAMLALLANPIVLILAAIVALFSAMAASMKRSEDGQDRLNKVWRVAASVFDNILDILTAFGVALFDTLPAVFENLGVKFSLVILKIKKGFKEAQIAAKAFLGMDVTELLGELDELNTEIETNTKKSAELGKVIADGFSGAIEKVKNLGAEIEADVKAAERLANLEAKFNKQERTAIVENAKLSRDSAKLRTKSEQLKKVEAEEAMKILEESFKLDQKVLDNELALAKSRVTILKEQSALASDTIEDKKAIAEAEAAVFAVETKFNELRRQRTRRLNILRLEAFKQENDRKKIELATEKLIATEVIKNNDAIVDSELNSVEVREKAAEDIKNAKITLSEETFNLVKAQLDKELELKLKNDEDYNGEMALLEAQRIANSKAVNEEYLDAIRVIYETSTANQIYNAEFQSNAELLILKQALADGAISREEFAAEAERVEYEKSQSITNHAITAIKKALDEAELSAEERLELERQLKEKLAELDNEELDNKLANIETEEAARAQLREAAVSGAMSAGDSITQIMANSTERQLTDLSNQREAELAMYEGNREAQDKINAKYAKKEAELKTKQAKADKTAAIIKAVVNTAIAVTSALGLFPPPLGIAMAAIVGIAGALQVAAIASKPIPQFWTGTDSSPDTFVAGDRGRELLRAPSGKLTMVEKPTIFTGMQGSKIWNNTDTETIMNYGNVGYDSSDLREEIRTGNTRIVNAIKNKKELHFNTEKRTITERDGDYYKTWFNEKLGI